MSIRLYTHKILIVEDDMALCSLINHKLSDDGFEVLSCHSGNDAIELIRKNIDLFVLMDYQLTDMLCTQIITTLNEEDIIFPFVIMTGYGNEKLAVDFMKMGALDYVIKNVGFANHITLVITRALNHLEIKNMLDDSRKEVETRERKYRRIFENIQDVYFELSKSGNITEISPSVEKILFFKRKSLLDYNIFHEIKQFPELNRIKNILQNKNEIIDYEVKISDFNKRDKYVSVTAKMTRENDNQYVVGIFRDITVRKLLEYKLINDVVEIEEQEKKRFAEDIHDGLGPLLSGIKLYINMLKSGEQNIEKREEYIEIVSVLIDEAVNTTRNITHELMPPLLTDFGLTKAIESFCKLIRNTNKFRINFTYKISDKPYEKNINIIIYRCIVELINNTIKHAKASRISISLIEKDNKIYIKYYDNGIGFLAKKSDDGQEYQGFGLRSISNRLKAIGGSFSIKSKPEQGISANIFIDLKKVLFLQKKSKDVKN